MYCILIEFSVLPGKEGEFVEAWTALTEYIYQTFGSRGSRLHRNATGTFIAYAQWPSKEVYERAGEFSEEGVRLREAMYAFLVPGETRVLDTLEVVKDLTR